MQLSSALIVPATITSPSTSRALAKIEPIKEVCATTKSAIAKSEEHDEELGQVTEGRLQEAGDGWPEAHPDLLGRQGDHPGKSSESEGRGGEGKYGVRAGIAQHPGDRGDDRGAPQEESLPRRHAWETFIF